jgi:hypothetical protein
MPFFFYLPRRDHVAPRRNGGNFASQTKGRNDGTNVTQGLEKIKLENKINNKDDK